MKYKIILLVLIMAVCIITSCENDRSMGPTQDEEPIILANGKVEKVKTAAPTNGSDLRAENQPLEGTSLAKAIEPPVDQFQLDGSQQNQAIHSTRPVGQTFTVGTTGKLIALELSLFAIGSNIPDLSIDILDVRGGLIGAPVIGTVNIPQTSLGPSPTMLTAGQVVTGTLIDLRGLDIRVVVGDSLAFRLSSDVQLPALYAIRIALTNFYPSGEYFVGQGLTPNADAAFKTFVMPGDRRETGD